MLAPPPPPVPIEPPATVVAGPVIDAGRMAWAEQDGETLSVRLQGPRGRVTTIARFGRPAAVGAGARALHSVDALDLDGRRVTLTRTVSAALTAPPCGPGCYAVPQASSGPLAPPRPVAQFLERGTVAGLRERELGCAAGVGARAGFTRAGLVVQDCARTPDRVRIRLGERVLARGAVELVGTRGAWAAWSRGGSTVRVRNLERGRRSYTVRVPASADVALGDAGRLVFASTEARPSACGLADTQAVVRQATPDRPRPRVVVRDAIAPHAAGGVVAYLRVVGCPFTLQAAYAVGGRETRVGEPLGTTDTGQLDTEGNELAVLAGGALRRYAVSR